jgi:hypothetical protein
MVFEVLDAFVPEGDVARRVESCRFSGTGDRAPNEALLPSSSLKSRSSRGSRRHEPSSDANGDREPGRAPPVGDRWDTDGMKERCDCELEGGGDGFLLRSWDERCCRSLVARSSLAWFDPRRGGLSVLRDFFRRGADRELLRLLWRLDGGGEERLSRPRLRLR